MRVVRMCRGVRADLPRPGMAMSRATMPKVTVSCMTVSGAVTAVAVAAEAADGHSDQSDAPKGESGQVNVHALIYSCRPSP